MTQRIAFIWLCAAGISCAAVGCSAGTSSDDEHAVRPLRVATTTSTVNTGLLDTLTEAFTQQSGLEIRTQTLGSGQALQAAREGQADMVIVHARQAENLFMREGYGINRVEIMYNDFVLLGPPSDPAGIQGPKDVVNAFKRIAEGQQPFISRGDQSGTHMRELALWKLAEVEPSPSWYEQTDAGQLQTLKRASEQQAYVISDRGTWLSNMDALDLTLIVESDPRLDNPYSAIAANPGKIDGANLQAAMKFIDFLISKRGQRIIADFGVKRFQTPLFSPIGTLE